MVPCEGRLIQLWMYYRNGNPDDNHYAHPLDFIPVVDLNLRKVCCCCKQTSQLWHARASQRQRVIALCKRTFSMPANRQTEQLEAMLQAVTAVALLGISTAGSCFH